MANARIVKMIAIWLLFVITEHEVIFIGLQ